MKTYRWANPEETMATDGNGEFIPKSSPAFADIDPDVDVDPPRPPIGPYRRFDDVAAAREALLTELAARRWRAQLAMSYDGVDGVAFGADTIGNLLGTMQGLALAGPGATTPWKLGRGAHRVWTLAQVQAFAMALKAHTDACFVREGALSAAIEAAATVEDAEAIDLDAGWPA